MISQYSGIRPFVYVKLTSGIKANSWYTFMLDRFDPTLLFRCIALHILLNEKLYV